MKLILFLLMLVYLTAGAKPRPDTAVRVGDAVVSEALTTAESEVSRQLNEVRDAYVCGKITRCDVARIAVEMAERAEDWSRRFVLLKGAVVMYCKGGDFVSAEKTYVAMTNSQHWLTAELCNCVLDQALRGVSDDRSSDLCMIVDRNISIVRIKEYSEKLLTDPENVLLHRKLGEQYAVLGDWGNALEHFMLSGGEFARIAKQELSALDVNWKEIGDFWWLASDDKADLLHEEYRIHARSLYERSMRDQSKGR